MIDNVDKINRLKVLADKRNIHLADSNLPDSMKSVYVTDGKRKVIMVSENIATEEKISEIAFCLGHAILHIGIDYNVFRDEDILFQEKLNMRADRFANKLLTLIN